MGKPSSRNKNKKDKKDRKKESKKPIKKKVCGLCQNKVTSVDYKDVANLRKYVNEKNKVAARRATGACAHHQRLISNAIKRAREMALLPYCTAR